MKPDPRFLKQPKSFWANVRTISQEVGYTEPPRATGRFRQVLTDTDGIQEIWRPQEKHGSGL